MATKAADTEQGIQPPPRVVVAAGSHDDITSTIVAPLVKPGGNEALPPTLPTAPLPSDPTRTAASTAASTAQPAISPALFRAPERYQILGEHGRGGLGRVSRAHDRELGRDVAIKELIARTSISEVRFLREAMITARLEHPGIVPIHEAGRWPDGTPYYAMKLVAGRPLRDLIAERTTVDQRIGLLHHVIAVADAIAYAHGRNIIHRDLKPANVIVGDFGETIVIDWGLAKDLSASSDDPTATGTPSTSPNSNDLTATGAVLGTPSYMAPEQERGEHVDQRADVFAIGAMLWELCSLQKVPPTNLRHRHRLLRRAGIDEDLAIIIDKSLDPDAAHRYTDATALAADLKAFKSGIRIAARSYSLLAVLSHWTRRHRAFAVSLTAGFTLALIGVIIYMRNIATERDQRDVALAQAQATYGDLTLEHAELLLRSDPTAALATLSGYHGNDKLRHLRLVAEARGRGVAKEILAPHSDTIWFLVGDKNGAILSVGEDGRVQLSHQKTTTTIASDVSTGVRLAYSPTKSLLAYATSSNGIALLDVSTKTFKQIATVVTAALEFAPDGERLATLDVHGELTVWSVASSSATHTFRRQFPGAYRMRYMSPTRVILQTPRTIHATSIEGPENAATVNAPGVSSFDGTAHAIALGFLDGTLRLYSDKLIEISSTRLCHERVSFLSFIPNSNTLAFACTEGYSGFARYADDLSGLDVRETFPTRRDPVVTCDPSGRFIAATDETNTLYLYDTEVHMFHRYVGSSGSPTYISFPTSDFQDILIGDANGTVRVWDPPSTSARIVLHAPNPIYSLFFGPDSSTLLSNGSEPIARYINIKYRSIAEVHGHSAGVLSGQISPTGTSLLTYGYDGTVRVVRTSDFTVQRVFREHGSLVEEANYNNDGQYVVSVGDDGRLLKWSPTGSDMTVLFKNDSPLTRLEVLATNHNVVVTDRSGAVWEVSLLGIHKQIRQADKSIVTVLRASRDGKLLATGTDLGTVVVYETTNWNVKSTFETHGSIRQIVFDPKNRDLLVASEAGRTPLGHVLLLPLDSPRAYHWHDVSVAVRDVAYAPDGETLAFVCADGSSWLYYLVNDRWSYANDHDTDTLVGIFSPDGRSFASSDSRGVVIVRDVITDFTATKR